MTATASPSSLSRTYADPESAWSPGDHRQAALDLLAGHGEVLEALHTSIRTGVAPHASVLALEKSVLQVAAIHASLALSAQPEPVQQSGPGVRF